ncbi:MAG: LysR family transcriptional regulator [Mogibacterium sp.]|nr:LysR family transcriptional regulator [Mogibacterium sp.]
MEIMQLKEFTMLVKTLSYSETAFRLNVSTSALSRHIQQLEDELGEKLFVRTTRSIALTKFGTVFLPHAIVMLQDYDDCMSAVDQYKSVQSSSFTLGTYYSVEEYDLLYIVGSFREKNPQYNPVLNIGTMDELERGFLSKVFNVYTAIKNPAIKGQKFVKVGDCVIRAVVSSNSELSKKKSLGLADLADIPLFVPGRDTPYFKEIKSAFNTAGIAANFSLFGRFEDSIHLIKSNVGVGLFQFIAGDTVIADGLKMISLDPQIIFEYGLGYRDNLSVGEQAFVQHIRDYAKTRNA